MALKGIYHILYCIICCIRSSRDDNDRHRETVTATVIGIVVDAVAPALPYGGTCGERVAVVGAERSSKSEAFGLEEFAVAGLAEGLRVMV